jgi:hypothetical protein
MTHKNVAVSYGSVPGRLPIPLAMHEFLHSGLLSHLHESCIPGTICLMALRVKPRAIKNLFNNFSTPEPPFLAYYWLVWRSADYGTGCRPVLRPV